MMTGSRILSCGGFAFFQIHKNLKYSVSQKTSPTFLAVTRESIVGFS